MKKYTAFKKGILFSALAGAVLLTSTGVQLGNTTALADQFIEEHFTEKVLPQGYDPDNGFLMQETVYYRIDEAADLENLNGYMLPTGIILRVDDSLNVLDKDNGIICDWASFAKDQAQYMYMVFEVDTVAQATAVASYYKTDATDLVYTAMLISESEEVLAAAKQENVYLKTAWKVSGDLSSGKYGAYVSTANHVGAYTIIFDGDAANLQGAITHAQARYKAIWVDCDTDTQIYDAIGMGAYGVVTDDFENAYQLLENYGVDTLSRTPYIVAHRGLTSAYNENSLEGAIAAKEAGATHVELDIQLTADERVIVMHDGFLGTTTNGKGTIDKMTWAEIQQYQLVQKEPASPIPLLDDFYEEFQDSEDFYLIVELKSSQANLVPKLKELTERYGMTDKIVVISFMEDQLKKMHEVFPDVPTAALNPISLYKGSYLDTLMETYCTVSSSFGGIRLSDIELLSNMGMATWLYTFNGNNETQYARAGAIGLTTDAAEVVGDFIRTLLPKEEYEIQDEGVIENGITIEARTYKGDVVAVTCDVTIVQGDVKDKDGALAILSYETERGNLLYTKTVRLTMPQEEKVESVQEESNAIVSTSGCGGTLSLGLICPSILATALLIRKHKDNRVE